MECLTDIKQYSGPSVILPDAKVLAQSQQGTIPISNQLSKTAQQATVLQNLKSSSLISLGQICDDQCTIVLDNKKLYATKSKNIKIDLDPKNIILKGFRNPLDGLYDIPIEKTTLSENNYVMPRLHAIYNIEQTTTTLPTKFVKKPQQQKKRCSFQLQSVNNMSSKKFNNIISPIILSTTKKFTQVKTTGKMNVILRKDTTKRDLVTFLHGAVCSPVTSMWVQAIDNNQFTTWPGLSSKLV